MNPASTHYQPINCEFHDLLEDLATVRKRTRITFLGAGGDRQHRDAVVTDVYAREGAEYLSMDSGEILRLDQLVEVDGARLADYGNATSCEL